MAICRNVLKCTVVSIEHLCALLTTAQKRGQTCVRTADSDAYSYTVLVLRCAASSQTVQVDALVLSLFENARKAKYAVTRAVGRSATKTLLASATTSADKERLEGFQAGETWAKNFVVCNGLASKRLYGEAGSMNPKLVAKGTEKIREDCKSYLLENKKQRRRDRHSVENNAQAHVTFHPRGSADGEGHKGHELQGSRIDRHAHERLWHGKGGDGDHRRGQEPVLLSSQSLPSQLVIAGQRVV